ncbi:MAG: DUF853 family protein [Clostridia bacterium]|nr:DUF853 family protein [Clostridia bacterium]
MYIGIDKGRMIRLEPKMANRHGLVTGATGTGKTVTLQVLAENFSDMGVPVFLQDIKGDLTGVIEPGSESRKFRERLDLIGLEKAEFRTFPTTFWDIFGEDGHPIRTTVSEMGPLMLSRLLDLNDTQTAVMFTVFKFADENGLLLLDFKDLLSIIDHIVINSKSFTDEYRTISIASVGAIKRKLVILETEGIEHFFGEPAFDIRDLMVVDNMGRGMINILESSRLYTNPSLYSTFLLWLLSELFEELDEVGDPEKPRLVFFFDEAHLIFKGMPRFLLEKFEQVVKLIRSKGVGVYFITQNPLDIPESVLGQLGNRIQHALRAYTPLDQRAVKVAADTFRQNPGFDTAKAITQLGVGEALISFLDEKGIPGVVERAYVMPPKSKIGPAADQEALKRYIGVSYIGGKYARSFDRHSAYEMLKEKADRANAVKKAESTGGGTAGGTKKEKGLLETMLSGSTSGKRRSDSALDRMVKSAASSIGTQVGRSLIRGILGSISK